jgi:Flp pilus assembly protein TadD
MGLADSSQRRRVSTDCKMRLLLKIFAFIALLFLVAGCNATTCSTANCETVVAPADVGPATTATLQDPDDVKYYRSDDPLRMGIEHFNRGHYGIAERYFRDATEKAPKDPTAWIGLAAAYDRIGRFDLADRAYFFAIKLVGETTEILNNQGYSYMLRGDLVNARKKFLKAYEREPNNPTVINNLQLLNSSSRFIQRAPAQ